MGKNLIIEDENNLRVSYHLSLNMKDTALKHAMMAVAVLK
jgi:hypothetical protein